MKFGLLAVAVLAAVLDHCLVDALASIGLFSSAHEEYQHVALLPALAAAATVIAVLGAAFRMDSRRLGGYQADWLAAAAARLRALPVGRTFVAVFVLQSCSLFTIESIEQVVSIGHIPGPFAWLGVSLPIAGAIGLLVAAAATAMLRTLCDIVHAASALIARIVGALIVALAVRSRPGTGRMRATPRVRFGGSGSVLAYRSGLRAPPLA